MASAAELTKDELITELVNALHKIAWEGSADLTLEQLGRVCRDEARETLERLYPNGVD